MSHNYCPSSLICPSSLHIRSDSEMRKEFPVSQWKLPNCLRAKRTQGVHLVGPRKTQEGQEGQHGLYRCKAEVNGQGIIALSKIQLPWEVCRRRRGRATRPSPRQFQKSPYWCWIAPPASLRQRYCKDELAKLYYMEISSTNIDQFLWQYSYDAGLGSQIICTTQHIKLFGFV